jgi:hypothetical protein
MNAPHHRVSLGALALVVCLALPAGLLSLFSEITTGEQVDASDLVLMGRVASIQVIEDPQSTAVELAVDHAIWGAFHARSFHVTVAGRLPAEVGDQVVAMVSRRPSALLGLYHLEKDPRTLEYEVVTPITGMAAQGVSGAGALDPVPLALFEAAIGIRRGAGAHMSVGGVLASRAGSVPAGGSEALVGPDAYEPNNTLATATPVTGLHAPTLLTGNPTILTGLTLTLNDVDFFSFEGDALSIVHAATLAPATGLEVPDTFMGLFDASNGELLAFNDDGQGTGKLSQLKVPLEHTGPFAVAVESAPDTNLDFAGDEGVTTGSYELSLELELGSYLWNQLDLVMGVSPDGTFIEDEVGFKEIGGQDVLVAGVPADGWALDYDVRASPFGATHVYGGAGSQLTDPGFTNSLLPLSFELAPFQDSAGFNRRGFANASSLVAFDNSGQQVPGVIATIEYTVSVGARTVIGDIALQMANHAQITDLLFSRVLDVDLFGTGSDQFFWSFSPTGALQAFAVDAATHVGNVVPPAQPFSNATGDLQAAMLIKHGNSSGAGYADITHYRTAFTLVKGYATAQQALNNAVRNLRDAGVDTWVVAVDQDPATNLYAAFGTGLGDL